MSIYLGRSYLRVRWARAQGLALRGASHLEDLPLNNNEGEKKKNKWENNKKTKKRQRKGREKRWRQIDR